MFRAQVMPRTNTQAGQLRKTWGTAQICFLRGFQASAQSMHLLATLVMCQLLPGASIVLICIIGSRTITTPESPYCSFPPNWIATRLNSNNT